MPRFHVHLVKEGGGSTKLPLPVQKRLVKQIIGQTADEKDSRKRARDTHSIIERAIGRGVPYMISDGESTLELQRLPALKSRKAKKGKGVEEKEEEEKVETPDTDTPVIQKQPKDPYDKKPVTVEQVEPTLGAPAKSAKTRFPPTGKGAKKVPAKKDLPPKSPAKISRQKSPAPKSKKGKGILVTA